MNEKGSRSGDDNLTLQAGAVRLRQSSTRADSVECFRISQSEQSTPELL